MCDMNAVHFIYPMSMLFGFISKEEFDKRFNKDEFVFWNTNHTIGNGFNPEDPYFHFFCEGGDICFESLDDYYAEQAVYENCDDDEEIFKFYGDKHDYLYEQFDPEKNPKPNTTIYKHLGYYNDRDDILHLFPFKAMKEGVAENVIQYFLGGYGYFHTDDSNDEESDLDITEEIDLDNGLIMLTDDEEYAIRFQSGSQSLLKRGSDEHGYYIDIFQLRGAEEDED